MTNNGFSARPAFAYKSNDVFAVEVECPLIVAHTLDELVLPFCRRIWLAFRVRIADKTAMNIIANSFVNAFTYSGTNA